MPLFVWAMLVVVADDHLLDAVGRAGVEHADLGPAGRHAISTIRPSMATRCCGSTCSGSSATPKSTSSSCPRPASSARSSRPSRRRPVFGYPIVVLALVSTGILAFGLWVHHMFATGLPRVGYSFYTAREHGGRRSRPACRSSAGSRRCGTAGRASQVPMLYVVGFIVTFVIGGLTGRDDRRGAARPAAARHLLHRRPFPLRADRRRGVPAARRPHLLVSRRSPAG